MNLTVVSTQQVPESPFAHKDQPDTSRVSSASVNTPDGDPFNTPQFADAEANSEVASDTGLNQGSHLPSPPSIDPEVAGGNKKLDTIPLPIVPFPTVAAPQTRSQLLEQWEGTVYSIGRTEFVARLRSLTDLSRPEEEAAISVEQVPDIDLPLLKEGSVFYWNIVYRVEPHGQKNLVSNVSFRRLPAWTKKEIYQAEQFASKYDELFDGIGRAPAAANRE